MSVSPLTALVLTIELPVLPNGTDNADGFAEIEKSRASTLKFTLVDRHGFEDAGQQAAAPS